MHNFLGILTPYKGNKVLISGEQSVNDIINAMRKAHNDHAPDYDKISEKFWRGDVEGTAKFIFDFLKKNVKYDIEPNTRQSVKSPAAILATGKMYNGKNDCKHYSLFAAGILDSLKRKGYPVDFVYRFANYRLLNSIPHHVFVVAKDTYGKNYWIDAVLKNFNERKPYINKKDVNMSLYHISGIGAGCNCKQPVRQRKKYYEPIPVNGFGQIELESIGSRKAKRKAKKAARKAKRKNRRTRLYCKGALIKKIALAPARNAFLALVGLNVKQIAVKLHGRLKNPDQKAKLSRKWCKLGGTFKKLENTINKGYAKYARRKKISGWDAPDEILIGAPITAMLAAAGPILVALKEFLGQAQELKEQAQSLFSPGQAQGNEYEEVEYIEQ